MRCYFKSRYAAVNTQYNGSTCLSQSTGINFSKSLEAYEKRYGILLELIIALALCQGHLDVMMKII